MNAMWALALLLLTSGAASGQDLSVGLEEFDNGNYQEAFRELLPLAENGDATAQLYVGWMFKEGLGTESNNTEAARWYELAANQGLADAQYLAAVLYELGGPGLRPNPTKALNYYRLAAGNGIAEAQHSLGSWYYFGDYVARDKVTAAMWFELSLENNDERSGPILERLASSMTEQETEEAKNRAQACRESAYNDCN